MAAQLETEEGGDEVEVVFDPVVDLPQEEGFLAVGGFEAFDRIFDREMVKKAERCHKKMCQGIADHVFVIVKKGVIGVGVIIVGQYPEQKREKQDEVDHDQAGR